MDLSLTFLELYRTEQIRQKTAGPINIYSAQHTILFLRGCADQNLCKRRCISNFLNQQHRNYDYLYHVAELCNLFPAYQCNIRTFTNLKDYLKAQHLQLAARYTLKALHTYDDLSLERWAKHTIREVGPYLSELATLRLSSVERCYHAYVDLEPQLSEHPTDMPEPFVGP